MSLEDPTYVQVGARVFDSSSFLNLLSNRKPKKAEAGQGEKGKRNPTDEEEFPRNKQPAGGVHSA